MVGIYSSCVVSSFIVSATLANPEPEPASLPPIETTGPVEVAPNEAAAETPAEVKWYDMIGVSAFADAYAGVNYNRPHARSGGNGVRAYDVTNGFALAWAGVDLSYEQGPLAGTIALRFGPSAQIYNGEDNGVNFLKQAYATWRPTWAKGKLSLDLGRFDTIYGGEVAESQLNMNYTRGVVYWLAQPLGHTGLRIGTQFTDAFGINLLAVNGWDVVVDNNRGKSYGLQFAVTPGDRFSMFLGYITGPEQDMYTEVQDDAGVTSEIEVRDVDRKFRHLVDLVMTIAPSDKFSILLNGDFGAQDVVVNPVTGKSKMRLWYGASLALRAAFTQQWGASLRGEWLGDPNDFRIAAGDMTGKSEKNVSLLSGTLTLDFAPIPGLLIRLDNRIDGSNKAMFAKGASDSSKTMFTTTLGLVASVF